MEKSVLIFDDDKDILNICKIILEKRGYTVSTSLTCKDLLETVLSKAPKVIVMDNKIPDIGGVEAVRKLRADDRTAHIPVIFFSADTHIAKLAADAGADEYLQKPFDLSEFERMLDTTISRNDQ